MSLKFLAVGQSLAGIRGGKSPYELRRENQLPTFPGAARFIGKQAHPLEKPMVQTDFLQSPKSEELEIAAPIEVNPLARSATTAVSAQKPKRRWLSFLRLKWFRASVPRRDLVQSEMSLEKVRVLRNDLADSDLELVLRKKKKTKAVFSASQGNNELPREGWSELTAKLFELGQK